MLTNKEFKVLHFLIENGHNGRTPIHGNMLKNVIFDSDVVAKYSHARRSKLIIDTMTVSYLGRMCRKGLIECSYNTVRNHIFYEGHYFIQKGLEEYIAHLEKIKLKQ